jgi:hypothetical protein
VAPPGLEPGLSFDKGILNPIAEQRATRAVSVSGHLEHSTQDNHGQSEAELVPNPSYPLPVWLLTHAWESLLYRGAPANDVTPEEFRKKAREWFEKRRAA